MVTNANAIFVYLLFSVIGRTLADVDTGGAAEIVVNGTAPACSEPFCNVSISVFATVGTTITHTTAAETKNGILSQQPFCNASISDHYRVRTAAMPRTLHQGLLYTTDILTPPSFNDQANFKRIRKMMQMSNPWRRFFYLLYSFLYYLAIFLLGVVLFIVVDVTVTVAVLVALLQMNHQRGIRGLRVTLVLVRHHVLVRQVVTGDDDNDEEGWRNFDADREVEERGNLGGNLGE